MELEKCLLVDEGESNEEWLKVMGQALTSLGLVSRAASMTQAVVESSADIDVIIFDVSTVQHPIHFAHTLRLCYPSACVLAFSASPDWKQARDLILAGASDYLTKTVDYEIVVESLRTALLRTAPTTCEKDSCKQ